MVLLKTSSCRRRIKFTDKITYIEKELKTDFHRCCKIHIEQHVSSEKETLERNALKKKLASNKWSLRGVPFCLVWAESRGISVKLLVFAKRNDTFVFEFLLRFERALYDLRKRGGKGKKRIEDKLLLVEVCGYVFPYTSASRWHLLHSGLLSAGLPVKGCSWTLAVLRRLSRFKSHPFAVGKSYIIVLCKVYRSIWTLHSHEWRLIAYTFSHNRYSVHWKKRSVAAAN